MRITEKGINDNQTIALCMMAYDDKFTSEVGFQIADTVWEDDWARLLSNWICEYVRSYGVAPCDNIYKLALERRGSILDEDTADSVCSFTKAIAAYREEHADLFRNHKFVADTVLTWARRRSLEVLGQQINNAMDDGNVARAEEALHRYAEIRRVECTATDIMQDIGRIASAYDEDDGELMTLKGDLGRMTGPLARGDLMLIMGESGTGKSWVSMEIGMQAMKQGLSVLYVNLENSDRQMVRRIYSNMTGLPKTTMRCRFPYFRKVDSVFDDETGEETATKWEICYREKVLSPPSTSSDDIAAFLKRQRLETNGGRFYLMSFPPRTLSVRDLERELDNLRDFKNFIPDVVIVDYIDLLRPEVREDRRLQIDSICLGLRSMALARDILIISPTQINRAGYGRDVRKENMSENIGNINHSAVVWGLNHTDREKDAGITRIRVLKRRDGTQNGEFCLCVGCLDVGRPIMSSRMMKDVVTSEGTAMDMEDDE